MSGVPPNKRIAIADLKGAPPWVEPLLVFVNSLAEFNTQAFAKGGINLDANIGTVKELQVETPAAYATAATFPVLKFPTGLTGQRAKGVIVIKVVDRGFPDAVLTGNYSCAGAWEEQGGEIVVRFVSGLEASHRYTLTFWVVS